MYELAQFHRGEIAPSVRALLDAFHEDTHFKLDLAPDDSTPIYERTADGWLCRVDEDGWLSDPDMGLDKTPLSGARRSVFATLEAVAALVATGRITPAETTGGAMEPIKNSGLLVTVDGAGGVGKSSTVQETAAYLRKIGVSVYATRQPSDNAVGSYIRAQADSYWGMALACLVAGDRHHQQATEIIPELDAGRVVLCDRYLPSSLVLQVLDGVAPDTVWALNAGVRFPDLAVLLRAAPEIIRHRLQKRGQYSRFETDPESSVRELELFEAVAEDLREKGWPIHLIDCTDLRPHETARVLANLIIRRLDDDALASEEGRPA
ncbi:dTMP kinase [Nocardia sp. CA-135953]|uniref:dTMP kinase n=1 Tax=Nocardia sp. CA-135953 TaxID=3239978 RepID=UPI003D95CF4D